MNLFNLLGGPFTKQIQDAFTDTKFQWLKPVANFLDNILVPALIILLLVGTVWVITIGVQLARAETPDKATEAKKRLINVIIAFVATIVFIFLLTFLAAHVPDIFGSGAKDLFTE